MKERTLVYMTFRDGCIILRTVSRSRKSPHNFYIYRRKLETLEHGIDVTVHDLHSFAILRLNAYTRTVDITFTWLKMTGNSVSGYQDTITLPYYKMMECLHESALEHKTVEWKALSMDDSTGKTKIVFKSRKNLHAVVENGIIRRKLARFLRGLLAWKRSEKIEIYDDFVPYSFFFRETIDGSHAISGGIILHGQENMETAYYSMHT